MNINYPTRKNEFELQAELYSKLKEFGFDVKGEVKYCDKNQKKGWKHCRFDLIVFKNKEAICIIEVKDRKPEKFNPNKRQFQKYSKFNLPLIYYYGEPKDYEEIIRIL